MIRDIEDEWRNGTVYSYELFSLPFQCINLSPSEGSLVTRGFRMTQKMVSYSDTILRRASSAEHEGLSAFTLGSLWHGAMHA